MHPTSTVIRLPSDPARLRAGMSAVRARARQIHASASAQRSALTLLLTEMRDGRSTAAAVALANASMRRPTFAGPLR